MNQVSALASNQLEAWEKIAKDWILVPSYIIGERKAEQQLICPKCNGAVYPVQSSSVTPAILLSSTVAHLRNLHRELDPDA